MARCGGGTHRASGHRAFPDGGDRAPFRWEGAGTSHTITHAVVGPPNPNQRWPFRACGVVPSDSLSPWASKLGRTGLSPQKPGTSWATRVSRLPDFSTPPPPHFLSHPEDLSWFVSELCRG